MTPCSLRPLLRPNWSASPRGPRKLRLPVGAYRIFGGVWEYVRYRASVPETSVAVAQRLTLAGDRTLRTDLSTAKPVLMGIDDPEMRINEWGSATGLVSSAGAGVPEGLVAPLYSGAYRSYAVLWPGFAVDR